MIVYDVQALQSEAHGERGIARFTLELANAIERIAPGTIGAFAFDEVVPPAASMAQLAQSVELVPRSRLNGTRPELLHVTSPFELGALERFVTPIRPTRTVLTCYDLIPLRFAAHYLPPGYREKYRTRLQMLVNADAIVTDSRSAADDVHELLGYPRDRLTVVGAGTDERFVPPTDPLEARLSKLRAVVPQVSAGYLLCPTGYDWRKNIDGALQAYALLDPALRWRHQLVLNCKVLPEQAESIMARSATLGIDGSVLLTGYVPDELLVTLYQTAHLVVFPSFYEGFGLPVLEARRCGAPVVCADNSSLRELITDSSARFDATDPASIADRMRLGLTDEHFRSQLLAIDCSEFTWDNAARHTIEVYERLERRRRRPTSQARTTLAVSTILPPTASGVADHSAFLLEELSKLTDVTAYVPSTDALGKRHSYRIEHISRLPVDHFLGEHRNVLHILGNNRLHIPALEWALRLPGWVFLHDVRLKGCVPDTIRWQTRDRYYPGTMPTDDDNDVLWAAPAVGEAIGVLCQSAHAADMLAADSGRQAVNVGPIPFPVCDPAPLPTVEEWPAVISTGILSDSKQSGKFAEAAQMLIDSEPGTRAALVGLGSVPDPAAVPDVRITGRVSGAEYDRWLRSATVAVQLRDSTNGESSGAVAYLLARGIPTVVTDIGAMSEFPDDIVVKVPREITARQLSEVIESLIGDVDRRTRLHVAARDYAALHTYRRQAELIIAAIDGCPA